MLEFLQHKQLGDSYMTGIVQQDSQVDGKEQFKQSCEDSRLRAALSKSEIQVEELQNKLAPLNS